MKIFYAFMVAFTLYAIFSGTSCDHHSEPCTNRDVGFNQGQRCD